MAFTYLKVKSAKCICLLPMVLVLKAAVLVLVLRMYSRLHHIVDETYEEVFQRGFSRVSAECSGQQVALSRFNVVDVVKVDDFDQCRL